MYVARDTTENQFAQSDTVHKNTLKTRFNGCKKLCLMDFYVLGLKITYSTGTDLEFFISSNVCTYIGCERTPSTRPCGVFTFLALEALDRKRNLINSSGHDKRRIILLTRSHQLYFAGQKAAWSPLNVELHRCTQNL
uniref:Uncharacterized protein n=1 Tax=Glossina palpalis gambiensis TaxID=67801 RepID=A0A1B0AQ39_9MUSC